MRNGCCARADATRQKAIGAIDDVDCNACVVNGTRAQGSARLRPFERRASELLTVRDTREDAFRSVKRCAESWLTRAAQLRQHEELIAQSSVPALRVELQAV